MDIERTPTEALGHGLVPDQLDRWVARLHAMGHLPASQLRAYLRNTQQTKALSAADEATLGWSIINDGCARSRERMLQTNIRLLTSIAERYLGRGLTLTVLIDEGSRGLRRAVDDFDPARGARFSTGASWWIKSAIRRVLHEPRLQRVPASTCSN